MYPKNWTEHEDKIPVLREECSGGEEAASSHPDCSIIRTVGPAAGRTKNLDDVGGRNFLRAGRQREAKRGQGDERKGA